MLTMDDATRDRLRGTPEFNHYVILLLARSLVPAAMEKNPARFIGEFHLP